MNKSKEKIIIASICVITLIAIISIIIINIATKKSAKQNKTVNETLYSNQLLEDENQNPNTYPSHKATNIKIASKYPNVQEAYTVDADVDMYLDGGKMGEAIYVRDGNTQLNILQFKYEIKNNSELPEIMQIDDIMKDFEQACFSEMGSYEIENSDNNSNGKKIPASEIIFVNKELVSTRYVSRDVLDDESNTTNEPKKIYDINFYMDSGNILICEFVRVL